MEDKVLVSKVVLYCYEMIYYHVHPIPTSGVLDHFFADIAVGAPYEGNGVVYIYHGSVDGLKHEPAQIIRAEDIDQRIKGFGISLSKGVDVDGNHYNGT
jgi:hypothetical protein